MVNWRLSSLTSKGSIKLGRISLEIRKCHYTSSIYINIILGRCYNDCTVSQSQQLNKKEGPSEI